MRYTVPSSSPARRRNLWHDETGNLLAGVLAAVAALTLILAFALPQIKNAPDKAAVKGCLAIIQTEKAILTEKTGGDPNAVIAADDPSVVKINQCKAKVDEILNRNATVSSSTDAASLNALVKQINDLTVCSITQPQSVEATVGQSITIGVVARITLENENATGTINSTTGESGAITRKSGFTWSGNLVLSGQNVQPNTTSQISVIATSPGNPPITCPSNNSVQVSWKPPPPPKIDSFAAAPAEILPTQTSKLSYKITNAKSATINPGGFTLGTSANSTTTGGIPVSPSKTGENKYTLTATTPGANPESVTAEATVTVKTPPTGVTITAPAANAQITDNQVTVSAIVSPPPPQGETFTGRISVNGSPGISVPITGSGQFSASVALTKKTTPNKLQLSGLASTATSCESAVAQPVTVTNTATADEVSNTITVVVELGGDPPAEATASVVVYHAVRVQGYLLTWGPSTDGCNGGPDPHDRSDLLAAGGSAVVGTPACGKTSESCNASPTVSITTSVGAPPSISATWAFSCDSGGGEE